MLGIYYVFCPLDDCKFINNMNRPIRISKHDLTIIKKSFKKHFNNQDHLWLFGSRVDPHKKGGDLDFYIETLEPNLTVANQQKTNFIIELQDKLGDQKIDVVINILSSNYEIPIYNIARETGVQLL